VWSIVLPRTPLNIYLGRRAARFLAAARRQELESEGQERQSRRGRRRMRRLPPVTHTRGKRDGDKFCYTVRSGGVWDVHHVPGKCYRGVHCIRVTHSAQILTLFILLQNSN
jgi:hypothetical protein